MAGEDAKIKNRKKIFSTPWFDLLAKTMESDLGQEPYYALKTPDFVSVVALNQQEEVLLIRQYRPAVEQYTIELPSGHVEGTETPEEAALRELQEETGYHAEQVEFLGSLIPDAGRMQNRMWCYWAHCLTRRSSSGEHGLEVKAYAQTELADMIQSQEFSHALHLSTMYLAVLKGYLTNVKLGS